jgi:hypothetical protein
MKEEDFAKGLCVGVDSERRNGHNLGGPTFLCFSKRWPPPFRARPRPVGDNRGVHKIFTGLITVVLLLSLISGHQIVEKRGKATLEWDLSQPRVFVCAGPFGMSVHHAHSASYAPLLEYLGL